MIHRIWNWDGIWAAPTFASDMSYCWLPGARIDIHNFGFRLVCNSDTILTWNFKDLKIEEVSRMSKWCAFLLALRNIYLIYLGRRCSCKEEEKETLLWRDGDGGGGDIICILLIVFSPLQATDFSIMDENHLKRAYFGENKIR